jgi:hypothetical protein
MNNPNPVPLSDFVANFVKSFGSISESIPWPFPKYLLSDFKSGYLTIFYL